MPARLIQHTFQGGEIAPTLQARSDIEKYRQSLAICRNFYPVSHGAVKSRPGTKYIGDVYDHTKQSRLLEFSFNDEQTYILEIGDRFMRVIKDGGFVTTPGGRDITTPSSPPGHEAKTAITNAGISTGGECTMPSDFAHDLVVDQKVVVRSGVGTSDENVDGKEFFVDQIYDAAGALDIKSISYTGSTRVKIELASTGANSLENGDRVLIQGLPEADDFAAGEINNRFLNNRVWTVQDSSHHPLAPFPFFQLDVTEISTADALQFVNEDDAVASGTCTEIDLTKFQLRGGTAAGALTGKTIDVYAGARTPWLEAELRDLKYTQSTDTVTVVHRNHAIREIIRGADHDDWLVRFHEQSPSSIGPPVGLSQSNSGAGSERPYMVTAVDSESGLESLQSNYVIGDEWGGKLLWTAPQYGLPERYFVYAGPTNDSGTDGEADELQFGFIGQSLDTSFGTGPANGIVPDYTLAPTTRKYPFQNTGNFPRSVAYYQQRLSFGGTVNKPNGIWMSSTGAYKVFSSNHPIGASDSILALIDSQVANPILELIVANTMYAMTSGGAFVIHGDDSGAITATGGFRAEDQNNYGISGVRALQVGDVVVYVQSDGNAVRDLAYVFENDRHQAADLTILSKHLFENNPIVEWAFSASPESLVWAVLQDGNMLSLTYLRDQKIFAWARHDTKGSFESIASILEGSEDAVYTVVKRGAKRFIERMSTRTFDDVRDAFCVDSGLSLTGGGAEDWIGDTPIVVDSITRSNPVRLNFSAPVGGHGFAVGELIDIEQIVEGDDDQRVATPGPLHNKRFKVSAQTTTTIDLKAQYLPEGNIDATGWTADGVGPELAGTVKIRHAVTTMTGLDHLDGETVSILADGSVQPQQVVAGGEITLATAASRVHVGLPYKCDMQTLEPSPESPGQSKQSIPVLVSEVVFRVDRSRGGFCGNDASDMKEIKQRASEGPDQPIELLTGELNFNMGGSWKRGQVFYRQSDPLPMTIMSIIYRAEFGA